MEVLFSGCLKEGEDSTLRNPQARSPQGVVAHILLVILAFLLAVLASIMCGAGFDIRHPSLLYFRSWLEVHGGTLLIGVLDPG